MFKKFEFEFEDESLKNRISFEYDDQVDEVITTSISNGVTTIYGNREAFMALAKTFAKIGLGEYKEGFHFHIGRDFGEEDMIEVTLLKS